MHRGWNPLRSPEGVAPYRVLLGILVVTMVVHPLVSEFALVRLAVQVLITLVYLGSLYAVLDRPRVRVLVGVLVAVGIAMRWWPLVHPVADGFHAGYYLLQSLFLGITALVILERVLRGKRVTTNTLTGAANVYLLFALVWASLFSALEILRPGSFHPQIPSIAEMGAGLYQHFLYFSLVTLSTLGYGDVAPISQAARSLAAVEAVFGQLYLAILLGRLVGLHVGQKD